MQNTSLEFNKRVEKFIPPKETWNPVEKALFTPSHFFSDYEKTQQLVFPAIKHSFTHHYTHNTLYHALCKSQNITPETIKTFEDLQ